MNELVKIREHLKNRLNLYQIEKKNLEFIKWKKERLKEEKCTSYFGVPLQKFQNKHVNL